MTLAEMAEYVGIYNNGCESGIEVLIRENKLFLRIEKNEYPLSKIGDRRHRFRISCV